MAKYEISLNMSDQPVPPDYTAYHTPTPYCTLAAAIDAAKNKASRLRRHLSGTRVVYAVTLTETHRVIGHALATPLSCMFRRLRP